MYMGNRIEFLKISYELLMEASNILKNNLNNNYFLAEIFINEKEELIYIKNKFGKYIQYEICDCYTSLIKVLKIYRNKEIYNIYKELKCISKEAELLS